MARMDRHYFAAAQTGGARAPLRSGRCQTRLAESAGAAVQRSLGPFVQDGAHQARLRGMHLRDIGAAHARGGANLGQRFGDYRLPAGRAQNPPRRKADGGHQDTLGFIGGLRRLFRALAHGDFDLQDFGLILEQRHDHAEGHKVLGKIPNHVIAGDVDVQRAADFSHREDQAPGQKGERGK